jgi:hypothetical protein
MVDLADIDPGSAVQAQATLNVGQGFDSAWMNRNHSDWASRMIMP